MTEDHKRIEVLSERLASLEKAYWEDNKPLVPDEVYDKLRKEYKQLTDEDRPIGNEGSGRKPLPSPMYSLDNVFNREDFNKWVKSVRKGLNTNDITFIVETKHDGLSISLHFKDLVLQGAYTRGNGKEGDDITDRLPSFLKELTININPEVEVRGEVYVTKSNFKKINSLKEGKAYINPRQCAVGILTGTDAEFKDYLSFKCYGLGLGQNFFLSESDTFDNFSIKGIEKTKIFYKGSNATDAFTACEKICSSAEDNDMPLDGAVVKVDDIILRDILGYTAHHPRWAIAVKLQEHVYKTTLTGVDWTIGVQGTITPTLLIEPVNIDGVTVSRATGDNASRFKDAGYALGDTLYVKRSGDVIPKIVLHEAKKSKDRVILSEPETCPYCNSPLEKHGAYLRCKNKYLCVGQTKARLRHFVSRPAMDLTGFGAIAINWCVSVGIAFGSDLLKYFIDPNNKETIFKQFGEKNGSKLISICKARKTYPLKKVLYSLAIPNVGEVTASKLSIQVKSLEGFLETFNVPEVTYLGNLGYVVSECIYTWIHHPEMLTEVIELSKLITTTVDEPVVVTGDKTVCFTGSGGDLDRSMMKQSAIAAGYKPVSSVTKKLNYLVVGKTGSSQSKIDKAISYKVPVISTDEWFKLRS